ncbi:Plasma-membrane choline transporter family protein [Abeliophyllum distichum]|uniref:Choline transporter-like protein n=1 Tax=Abeliophyllum distichum TaxID=126358 RepID=A0ABD1QXD5_9LAMI
MTWLCEYIFYSHILLITILVIILTIRGALSAVHTQDFHPKDWYIPVLASTAFAGIVGFAWQAFTRFSPSKTIRIAFWLSPLLTCAVGILLICIGTPVSSVASAIAFVSAIIQSIYACCVNPRLENATNIVTVSIVDKPPKVTDILLSIIIGTLCSAFLVTGIGGATATGTRIDSLFIFLIIASLTWTMQIIENTIQVAVSHVKFMQFAHTHDVAFMAAFKSAVEKSMGGICFASIFVPVVGVITGLARTVSMVSGDVNEFMFSSANYCSGITSWLVAYGNRWGFVHEGVFNRGIARSSNDTRQLFRRREIQNTINSDLTSSFCFLTGVAAGAMSALIGGIWAFVIHRSYATGVTMYTFFTGYLLSRVAMAWIQASVSAYYVAYSEYPQNQRLDPSHPAYMTFGRQRPQV